MQQQKNLCCLELTLQKTVVSPVWREGCEEEEEEPNPLCLWTEKKKSTNTARESLAN